MVGALPLALRVAGALLRNNPALSVAAYQERLAAADRRLGALRDPDDPQLNVEASLNLSYDALPVSAQAALRQLGALVADFDISLGLALIGRDDRGEEDLYALLRRNLVSYDPASTRWRLHDLIRSQALRKLIDAGEFAAASWRYVDAVLDIIRPLHTTMHSDSWNRNEALARFDRERPHLGEIWEWASAHQGEPAADRVLIDFALHTANIGNLRFDLRNERLPQLSAALAAAQRSNNEMAAVRLLNGRATIYNRLGLLREAIAANTEALDRIRKIDGHDEIEKALILRDKALLSTKLGTDEGLRLSNTLNYEALDIFKKHRVSRHIHFTLNNIGVTHLGLREFDQAITILNELLILGRDEQLEESERLAVHNLAETYMRIGKIEQALPLYEQSATIAAKNGNLLSQAYALEGIGRAYAMLGSPEQAFDHFERSLGILQSKNAAWAIAICQWSYGLALVRYGDSERGLPRLRACLAYEESVGYENIAVHRALVERIEAGGGLSQDELAGIIV
ncbi:MAG TPA: tetratricopeptide repeat protein [Herpetosiphonaceae bacterium]